MAKFFSAVRQRAAVVGASALCTSGGWHAVTHHGRPSRCDADGGVKLQPASLAVLRAYAADQRGEVAAGRGPRRLPEIDERYRRYFKWAASRGQTGVEYLVLTAQWRTEHNGPWVALEPNIVAYNLEEGIEHWNLWYHPRTTPGNADLDMQVGSLVEFVSGPCLGCRGRIRAVRRNAADDETFDVTLLEDASESGKRATSAGKSAAAAAPSSVQMMAAVRRDALQPCGWEAVLHHVRIFLPHLNADEVVIFQNVPEFRSVPEVAHAHIFFRPKSADTREELRRLRASWRLRSPWAEHERLTGRGYEVGFDDAVDHSKEPLRV
eukprot:TRINITY_DN15531_c0_g1_i1.p1 TRINITY_DN15531_c0_g1~~TRINITY_DN15531_c0_g1_i1.p1  ORF type:complete len:336 (+),score=44.72 TRINITY_DN15531_c0_g1_i1:43-1008(+)